MPLDITHRIIDKKIHKRTCLILRGPHSITHTLSLDDKRLKRKFHQLYKGEKGDFLRKYFDTFADIIYQHCNTINSYEIESFNLHRRLRSSESIQSPPNNELFSTIKVPATNNNNITERS